MIVKAAVLFVVGLLFGLRGSDRWLFALGLAQVGEFAFVLLSLTVSGGVLPAELADRLSLVVALSMLLTPLLFILHDRVILPRFAAVQERRMDEIRERADIIIAGHGRFGGIVNRLLRGAGYSTIVVDYSSQQLETLRSFGVRLYFGDAIRELYDGSIRAGRSALEALGEPRETAEQRAHAFEAMDRKFMVELADLYDSEIPTHENGPYVAKVRQMLADWEANLGGTKAPPPEVREGRG
jgi:CPA2 family monovalent cation:H+ antiporter-2